MAPNGPPMASLLSWVPILLVLGVNTAIAALLTRVFRVRLDTTWGAAVFVAFFVPVLQLIPVIVVGSLAGPNLQSPALVLGLLVALPLAIGVTIDVFWMPAPEDVELPTPSEQ